MRDTGLLRVIESIEEGIPIYTSQNETAMVLHTASLVIAAVTTESWNGTFSNQTYPTNSTEYDENQFILPWWRQLIWTLLFAGMVLVATGGNLIVIWIVLVHKRMRTVTNYFLVNLSIADTMVSTLNVTFNYIYMLNFDWPFGTIYCKITQFVAILSICASVFTLMAISIDRYVAIIKPLRPRMGRRTTLCIAGAIWILGSILALPQLLFYTTEENKTVVCYPVWPDGPTNTSKMEYWYNVAIMVVLYVLPICSMTYTYTLVGLELWGSKSIGECTQRQLDSIRSKRRVVKMMMVVVAMFAVCWLPYHVYFIVSAHVPEMAVHPYIHEIYLAIYWLAMSNSMYNPIIYCWMNSRFRRGFKAFLSWCPCVDADHEPPLTRREVLTSRCSFSASPETQCHVLRNGGNQRTSATQCSPAPNTKGVIQMPLLGEKMGSGGEGSIPCKRDVRWRVGTGATS